jgi:predicted RNA methylase
MFGDLDPAVQMLEKKQNVPFEPVIFFFYCSKICPKEALICASLVRNNRQDKRNNLKNNKHILKQLTVKNDCPENYQHKQQVEAKLKSLGMANVGSAKQKRAVRARYDLAVDEACE